MQSGIDIHVLNIPFRRASEFEKVLNDKRGPICVGVDSPRTCRNELRIIPIVEQKLRAGRDSGQGISDFMGDAARHDAKRGKFLALDHMVLCFLEVFESLH